MNKAELVEAIQNDFDSKAKAEKAVNAVIDAVKEDYLDYLRQLEPKLKTGAVIIADNTGVFRRDVQPYLDYVRGGGRYESREYDFGDDSMEVSLVTS